MNINHRLGAALLAGLLAAPVASQRTWTVDNRGGAGVDFTDLPPAVQAASPGDTIVVRFGDGTGYTAPTVSKGVWIVGDAPSQIQLAGHALIENVPVGETCALTNFSVQSIPPTDSSLIARDNRGSVFLEQILDGPDFSSQFCATDCDLVVLARCRMWSAHIEICFIRSRAVVIDCEFRGLRTPFGDATVEVCEGELTIVDSFMRGFDGREAWCGGPVTLGSPAVQPTMSTVYVRGRSHIEGGVVLGPCTFIRSPAIHHRDGARSTAVIDPLVTLVGPPDSRGTTFREMAAIRPDAVAPGRVQSITTYGPTGSTIALFGSLSTGRPPITLPFGDVFLDPLSAIHVATGAVDQDREHVVSLSLAGLPEGLPLVWQAGALTPSGALELSGPAMSLVR